MEKFDSTELWYEGVVLGLGVGIQCGYRVWVWCVGAQAAVPRLVFGEAWRTSDARIGCAGAGDAVLYPC